MLINNRYKASGFSLIEMLLVITIISSLFVLSIRYMEQKAQTAKINQASMQLQEILNAGVAYYMTNKTWPANFACLQGVGGTGCTTNYFPNGLSTSPYGTSYTAGPASSVAPSPLFFAALTVNTVNSSSIAQIIAGKLPLSTYTAPNSVMAYVGIPASVLNNAKAVQFVDIYHHGGCIPVPVCPFPNMTPEVMVMPASVSGVNDAGNQDGSGAVYAISSFTAFATGGPGVNGGPGSGLNPPACSSLTTPNPLPPCTESSSSPPATDYWRACLQLITVKGNLDGVPGWGQYVNLIGITRCAIPNEPSGSDYTTVYSN